MRAIGKPVPRKEGRDKVTGRSKYIDDVQWDGAWHGATVRSPVARGRVKRVIYGEGIPWSEFAVVTAADINACGWKNVVTLLVDDQPVLADDRVNHPEEPIVLIAHPDRHWVERARQAIGFEIDPLPAVFDIEESLSRREVIWGDDNVLKAYEVKKGDVENAFSQAGVIVVEGEYRTSAQEQLYIENNGVVAKVESEPSGGLLSVTVWGSMQCPYYVHKALVGLFALPAEKIRVVQTETGGGFGGKEEYPSIIAAHAALLAWKCGKPVKIVYDRAEDMAATTKRHPSLTKHRTAVSKDGKLLAMDIDFTIDGGAYATLSAVVLSRGTIHAAGPYLCPNVRVKSRAVATNCPPHGAFRGFGAPQSLFALEAHLDRVAEAVGLSPEELRKRNFLKKGDTTATGQIVNEEIDLRALLDRALELSDYHSKRARFAKENPKSHIKRGIGFASFLHGSGFTGSGEKYLASVVGLEATAEGRVRVLASSTEIGQGTNTIFSQIAAETLGVDYELIEVAQPDTAHVPNSGPTVASRTCMIVGKLVEEAARGLQQILIQSGMLAPSYDSSAFRAACIRYVNEVGPLRTTSQYKQPQGILWDDQNYRGDAYGAYAWAVYVAEVSVDTTTYEARVEDFVALQEVGKVIHPVLAAGQIEGGVAQGIGYALYEDVVWKDGRMANNRMTNYIMPTSMDLPPIRVFFDELPYAHGPAGAKGIGELPMDGPAPAIVNAIHNATGLRVSRIPVLPERLMEAAHAAVE